MMADKGLLERGITEEGEVGRETGELAGWGKGATAQVGRRACREGEGIRNVFEGTRAVAVEARDVGDGPSDEGDGSSEVGVRAVNDTAALLSTASAAAGQGRRLWRGSGGLM
jgi:hypothetical protein